MEHKTTIGDRADGHYVTDLDFFSRSCGQNCGMAGNKKKTAAPQQAKEHPPAKPSIKKPTSTSLVSGERNAHLLQDQRKGAGQQDKKEVQHPDRKKEDLDDMDAIFSSKPSKIAKVKALEVDRAKVSSSGPDMAEIAKEAEKYKGSSSQGLVITIDRPCIIFAIHTLKFILDFESCFQRSVLHMYELTRPPIRQAGASTSTGSPCIHWRSSRKRWANPHGTRSSRRQSRLRLRQTEAESIETCLTPQAIPSWPYIVLIPSNHSDPEPIWPGLD
jgi:hypothetical protein